jgi:hypothetical protein
MQSQSQRKLRMTATSLEAIERQERFYVRRVYRRCMSRMDR